MTVGTAAASGTLRKRKPDDVVGAIDHSPHSKKVGKPHNQFDKIQQMSPWLL